ncbi:MAG TPA: hypothetical protein VNZ26_26675 [Vicinamibacterales bacterium]|nr:hypothetical protein [Vicinamibacterales bacterium]
MTNTTKTNNRPTHTAYSVRDYQKNGKTESDWTRVGVAFAHRDGNGFDILLEAIPVNGRIALRKNKPKSEQAPEAPEQASQA